MSAQERRNTMAGATEKTQASLPEHFWQSIGKAWASIRRLGQHQPKRLRLCETLALGEHRFVAVVEFERIRFLIGGTQASLVLLAPLDNIDGENIDGGNKDRTEAEPETVRRACRLMKVAPAPGVRP
jgi:Flagellar biosynthesis protein, FliO